MTKQPAIATTFRRPPRRRSLVGVILVLGVLMPVGYLGSGGANAAAGADARAVAVTPHELDAVPPDTPLNSTYENLNRFVGRDVGISVVLPDTHELWFTGDTLTWTRSDPQSPWVGQGALTGTTALQGHYTAGQVPTPAEYPNAAMPTRFIPAPTNVYIPGTTTGQKCNPGNSPPYAARWPTGAAIRPDNTNALLVTYVDVCVMPGGVATVEGWGFIYWNWTTQQITVGPVDVLVPSTNGAAIPKKKQLGHPTISPSGGLWLFSGVCIAGFVSCTDGRAFYTSLSNWTTTTLSNPASYPLTQLVNNATGTTWTPIDGNVSVFPTGPPVAGVGLKMLLVSDVGGTYKLYSAASAQSTWHLDKSGTLQGCDTLPPGTGLCYALEGHWELNLGAPDNLLLVSYELPGSNPAGHLVMSNIHY